MMAHHDDNSEWANEDRGHNEVPRDPVQPTAAEYELTAKDAGWRTPTFLITPAKWVIFDPPRPRKRP